MELSDFPWAPGSPVFHLNKGNSWNRPVVGIHIHRYTVCKSSPPPDFLQPSPKHKRIHDTEQIQARREGKGIVPAVGPSAPAGGWRRAGELIEVVWGLDREIRKKWWNGTARGCLLRPEPCRRATAYVC